MRRWPAILAVLLAVAATAPAQGQGQAPGPAQGQAQGQASASPLRGPAQPDAGSAASPGATPPAGTVARASAAPATASVPAYMTPPTIIASRPPADPLGSAQNTATAQCMATCARDYYQCLAGEFAADCPSTWGQCNTNCGLSARKSSTLSPLGSR